MQSGTDSSRLLTNRTKGPNLLPYNFLIEGKAESIEQMRERILLSLEDDVRFGMLNIERAILWVFDESRTKQIYREQFPDDRLESENSDSNSDSQISG